LGGRRSSGCHKKKKNGDDTVHVHSPSGWWSARGIYHERIAATIKQKRLGFTIDDALAKMAGAGVGRDTDGKAAEHTAVPPRLKPCIPRMQP
jgi:hypothetical protein